MRTTTIGLLSFFICLFIGFFVWTAIKNKKADYEIELLNPEGQVRIYNLKENKTDTICVDELIKYIDDDNT